MKTVDTKVALEQVRDIFLGKLEGVVFPGVDVAVLEGHLAEFDELKAEIGELEKRLFEVKQRRQQASESGARVLQKALKYIEIFAEGDDGLLASIKDLRAPSSRAKRSKKGSKSKVLGPGDESPAQADLAIDLPKVA